MYIMLSCQCALKWHGARQNADCLIVMYYNRSVSLGHFNGLKCRKKSSDIKRNLSAQVLSAFVIEEFNQTGTL